MARKQQGAQAPKSEDPKLSAAGADDEKAAPAADASSTTETDVDADASETAASAAEASTSAEPEAPAEAAAAEPAPAAAVTTAAPEPEAPAAAAPASVPELEAETASQDADIGTTAAAAAEPTGDVDAEYEELPDAQPFIRWLESEVVKAEQAAKSAEHAWLLGLQQHLTQLKTHLERIPDEVHEDLHELSANVKALF